MQILTHVNPLGPTWDFDLCPPLVCWRALHKLLFAMDCREPAGSLYFCATVPIAGPWCFESHWTLLSSLFESMTWSTWSPVFDVDTLCVPQIAQTKTSKDCVPVGSDLFSGFEKTRDWSMWMQLFAYKCCGVINWSKFGGFNSKQLVQAFFKNIVCPKTL